MATQPPGRPDPPRPAGRGWVALATASVVAAVIAVVAWQAGGDSVGDRTASGPPSSSPTPAEPEGPPRTTTTAPAASPPSTLPARDFPTGIHPVRLRIPAIGVDATVVDLDLRGPEPEVPSDFAATGWYTQTRLPGEIGPAVIAGHVDSRSGPAVFYRLDQLPEGSEIVVEAEGGETRTFSVIGHGRYPKDSLPPEVLGFGDPVPELRLITCGGSFDESTGHYRDNHVVYAQEVT